MKVIYGISQIRKFPRPVVALGVFDGVHRGHRMILKAAVRKANALCGSSIAVTFWPHPQKEDSLYSLRHRLRLIDELGIDACVVINFNRQFSKMPALKFVKNILYRKLRARFVFVGDNFRFGKGAQGDLNTLIQLSKEYGFKVKAFSMVKVNRHFVSSTQIRSSIKNGDLGLAQKMLSRPVSILGTVIRGKSLGRKLGFPTANIDPHHEIIPPSGIYAAQVIYEGEKFRAACYIGPGKGFSAQVDQVNIEVNILDFRKNIYGKYLEIQFVKKIREVKRFDSPEKLVAQIQKDITLIKNLFSRR